MLNKHSLQAPDDDSGGGGGSGNDEHSDGDKANSGGEGQVTVGQLANQMALLTQSVSTISDGFARLSAAQQQLVDAQLDAANRKGGDGGGGNEPDPDEEPDLEALDRRGFAAHLVKGMRREMDKILEPIKAQVSAVSGRLDSSTANVDVERAAAKYKDFWEWKGEMGRILKANPTLPIKDAYLLARANDADKAEKMDKQFNKPTEKKAEPFGFFPGSSHTVQSKKLTPKQASDDAWDKTMADLGNVSRLQ